MVEKRVLNDSNVSVCKLPTSTVYADDTIMLAIALTAVLAVNKFMLFSCSRKIISDGLHLYSSDGSIIEGVPTYKYCTFVFRLTMIYHLKNL